MVTSYSLGYEIQYTNNQWIYSDKKESIVDNPRPCRCCGKYPKVHGYDYCLGDLPNVRSACCGHNVEKPYVVFNNGKYMEFDYVGQLKEYFKKGDKK